MIPLRLLPLLAGGGALVIGTAVYAFVHRQRKTPTQRETERRQHINNIGRITDGTVLDVQEAGQDSAAMQLLIYTYDVAGVTYECSQDITYLRQFVDLHSCKIGLPASIKYDPQNPGNSIVVTEGWSGLR